MRKPELDDMIMLICLSPDQLQNPESCIPVTEEDQNEQNHESKTNCDWCTKDPGLEPELELKPSKRPMCILQLIFYMEIWNQNSAR